MSTRSSLESLAEFAIQGVVREFMDTSWKQDLAEMCLNGSGTMEFDMEPYERVIKYEKNSHNILTGEVFVDGVMSEGITFWSSLMEAVQYSWPSMFSSRLDKYLMLKVF